MISAFPLFFRAATGRLARHARVMALTGSVALMLVGLPGGAAAQSGSPFAPILRINDTVITQYELDQRALFLKLLRVPGDPQKEAMKGLTQDRLAAQEAKRYGLRLNAQQVQAGLEEFATRANMNAAQLTEALAQAGVSAETYRDFVANGILWRELVRGRYLPTASVSEAEIDRAIQRSLQNTAVQVLLSEIVIPTEGDPEPQLQLARRLKSEIGSEGEFASAARRHSASPSAGRGGRIDWMPSSNLPPQILQMVLSLGPGQVSDPVTLPNAVAIFQLRDVTEDRTAEQAKVQVEYVEFLLPNTADSVIEATAIATRTDGCKDLFAEARTNPGTSATTYTRPVAEIPSDVGLLLASMDAGEYSTALVRGGNRVLVMLCGRAPQAEEGQTVDRNAVREQLISQKLTLLAEGYLEELRSEAIIKTP